MSQCSRIFSVYEGEIWCLCTGTFGQKSSKLNSRSVYCSLLYGTCCLVRPGPSAFSIEFQKNSNVICFFGKKKICLLHLRRDVIGILLWSMSEKFVKSRWLQLSCTNVLYHQVFPLKDWLRRITTLLLYGMMERYYRRNVQRLAVDTQIG